MGMCYLRHLFYVQISIGKYCQSIKKTCIEEWYYLFVQNKMDRVERNTIFCGLQGTRYSVGCIIVLNSSPTFGLLIDILLTDVDEHLFVCEALKLERYAEYLHAYEVAREKPTPIAFCKQRNLSDYHPLALYKLTDAMYIVPKYNIED